MPLLPKKPLLPKSNFVVPNPCIFPFAKRFGSVNMLPFRKGGFVETTTGFTKVENVDGKVVVTPMPPMKREVKTEKYMAVKKELASPVKEEPGFNPFKRERSPCEAVPDGGDAKRSRVNYEQLSPFRKGGFVVEPEWQILCGE